MTDVYSAAIVLVLGLWGILAWDAYRRSLRRDVKTVADLKHELAATQAEWTARFETIHNQNEVRLNAIEKRLNTMAPALNPLGSHYSTRGPG